MSGNRAECRVVTLSDGTVLTLRAYRQPVDGGGLSPAEVVSALQHCLAEWSGVDREVLSAVHYLGAAAGLLRAVWTVPPEMFEDVTDGD